MLRKRKNKRFAQERKARKQHDSDLFFLDVLLELLVYVPRLAVRLIKALLN